MAGSPCEFSESSYAFNFTENLWRRARDSVRFAPIFPNLRQEGAAGGGYDLLIRFGAVPVLFQFKIPDHIRRRSGQHRRHFAGPYYRFKLMPRRHSEQHQALLDHERAGTPVRYASPRFHRVHDLHTLSVDGHVPANSKILPPSVIGPLPDMADHHFDYDPVGPQYLVCSEPKPGKGEYGLEALLAAVKQALSDRPNGNAALSGLEKFAGLAEQSVKELSKGEFHFQRLEKLHVVQRCAFLTEAMGCAFFLAIPQRPQSD